MINSLTAEDAFAQLEVSNQEHVRVTIYGGYDPYFIDTEGSIEFCRICFGKKKWAVPVFPIDYGACLLAQELEVPAIEIEVSHPTLEKGIMRPTLIKNILEALEIPVWAGGVFSAEDRAQLLSWGCTRIIDYRIET